MENLSPVVFWAMIAAFWTILVGAVGATAWLIGRLSGKVDWKTYDENKLATDRTLTKILELLARLDERSKLAEHDPPEKV